MVKKKLAITKTIDIRCAKETLKYKKDLFKTNEWIFPYFALPFFFLSFLN